MRTLLLLTLLSLSVTSFASNVEVGSIIPSVEIDRKGQVTITDEKLAYQPWHSNKELGQRLAFIQHLAGRVGIKELNKSLSDAIVAQQIPPDLLDSVIIVNSDDSAFGTGWLVSSELKSNKKTYPLATFIDDSKGAAAKAWDLPKKSATSLIVSANGEILFSKDGATNDEDIARVISILKTRLPNFSFKTEEITATRD